MKNDIAKLNSLIKKVLAYGPSRKNAKLTETLADDVLKGRARVKKRIQKARQEIEDGALPKKGRFRF